MPSNIALFLAALLILESTNQAAVVRVRSSALVSGQIVRLGDVADVTARDADEQRRLESVTLGLVPAAGTKTRLSMQKIQSRVTTHGYTPAMVEYRGNSAVLIERSSAASTPSTVQSANLTASGKSSNGKPAELSPQHSWRLYSTAERRNAETIVRQVVTAHLARTKPEWGHPVVQPELMSTEIDPILQAGEQRLSIHSGELIDRGPGDRGHSRPGKPVKGELFLIALADSGNATPGPVVEVRVRVQLKPRVLGAKHDIPSGHVITTNDLMLVEVDHADHGTDAQDFKLLVGMKAGQRIEAGDPIKERLLKPVILVKRGDITQVEVSGGGIRVTKIFKAMGSGKLGDVITFQDVLNRRDVVSAQITGTKTAEILRPQTRPVAVKLEQAPFSEPGVGAN